VGRTATIIAVSYTIACAFAIVFMLFVAVSTRGRRRANQEGLRKLAGREKTWFAIVIVLLVTLLFATIFFTRTGAAPAHATRP
jgi:heme/copper-type cytochrome/quinol oxidase subunit 2